ncbi:hypothetical protein Glove_202g51 [Diversispora epigaea]|uniref:Uncharacterized protein n=1 Tax=Diversispora epigaea TaxID=1348612 RepID=A0A397IT98_9GLOM|nr:hypothetical protein Glove_202g51 [Diversispora epigaea]
MGAPVISSKATSRSITVNELLLMNFNLFDLLSFVIIFLDFSHSINLLHLCFQILKRCFLKAYMLLITTLTPSIESPVNSLYANTKEFGTKPTIMSGRVIHEYSIAVVF